MIQIIYLNKVNKLNNFIKFDLHSNLIIKITCLLNFFV